MSNLFLRLALWNARVKLTPWVDTRDIFYVQRCGRLKINKLSYNIIPCLLLNPRVVKVSAKLKILSA